MKRKDQPPQKPQDNGRQCPICLVRVPKHECASHYAQCL